MRPCVRGNPYSVGMDISRETASAMSDHRDDSTTVHRMGVGLNWGDKLGPLIHPRSMAEIALNCAAFSSVC